MCRFCYICVCVDFDQWYNSMVHQGFICISSGHGVFASLSISPLTHSDLGQVGCLAYIYHLFCTWSCKKTKHHTITICDSAGEPTLVFMNMHSKAERGKKTPPGSCHEDSPATNLRCGCSKPEDKFASCLGSDAIVRTFHRQMSSI